MLAPAALPEKFEQWNREHGAPYGFQRPKRELFRRFYSDEKWMKLRGPFGIQPGNNSTRRFEYPWAFHAASLNRGATVLEIGGSLSGFQFVLDRCGGRVINVDPGLDASGLGWPVDEHSIARLNRWFGTNVRLVNTSIDKAELVPNSIDACYSISVLEHLTDSELKEVMTKVRECLKPGGVFVITLDLFLNLAPFTGRKSNEYGTNKNVRTLVEQSGMQMLAGSEAELFGFDGFCPSRVLENLEKYLIGTYPALTECIVLQKTGSESVCCAS